MKALVMQNGFDQAMGRWVAIGSRHEICPEGLANGRNVFQGVRVSLADQFAGQCPVIEPAGEPISNRGFKRVVVEDGRIDEGGELRFAPNDFLGFAADPPPDRIELIESRFYLMLRHHSVSPEVAELSTISVAGIAKIERSSYRPMTHYI